MSVLIDRLTPAGLWKQAGWAPLVPVPHPACSHETWPPTCARHRARVKLLMRVSFVAIIVTITAANYLHGAQRRDQHEQRQKCVPISFLLLQNWNIKKKENHVSGASSGSTVGVDVKFEPPVQHAPDSSLLFLLQEANTSASRAGEGKGPLNSKPSTFFSLLKTRRRKEVNLDGNAARISCPGLVINKRSEPLESTV